MYIKLGLHIFNILFCYHYPWWLHCLKNGPHFSSIQQRQQMQFSMGRKLRSGVTKI
jgi:hypothetical protein